MNSLLPRNIRPLPQLAHLAGRIITASPFQAMRFRYRRTERLSVSRWSDLHRIVTEIDATPGDWDSSLVPHTIPIMDVIGLPWVRKICICMPDRAAKTQILVNAIGHFKDQGRRSGNIFLLYPTEADTKAAIGDRIMQVFTAKHPNGKPGRLNRYVSSVVDHTTRSMVRFSDKTRMIGAWANSPTSMAKYFGRFNAADEIDKFPKRTSEGASPIDHFEKRAREDRGNSKYLYASTPGKAEFICKMTSECDQIITWGLRCSSCHEYVVPGENHLDIPDGTTLENVNHADIGLACPSCGTIWTEEERGQAYRNGRGIVVKGAEILRPESVGAHCNSMQLAMIPLREIALKKLKAATGDREAKIDYAHGYLVEDFKEALADRKEDAILALRDDRLEAQLPAVPIAAISAVADMQKHGFWYKITAWGYGIEQESWLLKAGFVDSWVALRKLFFESAFVDGQGQNHVITLRGIDTGGGEGEGELSRTAEAIIFCYQNPGILPFKGQQKMSSLHRVSPQDKIPGTNKALPGGYNLYHLNATEWKNRLAAKLQVAAADPGAWHLHRDVGDDFARQMCAEGKDAAGNWQNPHNRPNHLWDCAYMELALVEIHQVKLWQRPDPAAMNQPPPRRVYSDGVQR